ncbi:MAG: cell wall hydrolase [Clostridia bacterium]|nr:cell wall hydrolase [Clostridia bacterium]
MKCYIKICLISSLIMVFVLGAYSLLFKDEREAIKAVNAEIDDSEIEEIIAREKKSFTASVCDSVCPNAPYLVKVAFCSVILNRCKNTSFPNTPAEVIMLDPAFVTALDRDYSEEPSSLSLMAYDDALSGFSPCPEALYYSTTETDDFAIKTRQTLFQIGKYIFS